MVLQRITLRLAADTYDEPHAITIEALGHDPGNGDPPGFAAVVVTSEAVAEPLKLSSSVTVDLAPLTHPFGVAVTGWGSAVPLVDGAPSLKLGTVLPGGWSFGPAGGLQLQLTGPVLDPQVSATGWGLRAGLEQLELTIPQDVAGPDPGAAAALRRDQDPRQADPGRRRARSARGGRHRTEDGLAGHAAPARAARARDEHGDHHCGQWVHPGRGRHRHRRPRRPHRHRRGARAQAAGGAALRRWRQPRSASPRAARAEPAYGRRDRHRRGRGEGRWVPPHRGARHVRRPRAGAEARHGRARHPSGGCARGPRRADVVRRGDVGGVHAGHRAVPRPHSQRGWWGFRRQPHDGCGRTDRDRALGPDGRRDVPPRPGGKSGRGDRRGQAGLPGAGRPGGRRTDAEARVGPPRLVRHRERRAWCSRSRTPS